MQLSCGADHPMTGNDYRQRIAAHRLTGGTRGLWTRPGKGRELGVAASFPAGNQSARLPTPLKERAALRGGNIVEIDGFAGEVPLQPPGKSWQETWMVS